MMEQDLVEIPAELRARFVAAGQNHVFKAAVDGNFISRILFDQLSALNLDEISRFYNQSMSKSLGAIEDIEPFIDIDDGFVANDETLDSWRQLGYNLISAGKVAVIILSGGQGTRLGFDGPKGMYNFGLPSNKTLFQLHMERIQAISLLSNRICNNQSSNPAIHVYIMTSDLNDGQIRDNFQTCGYYNYPSHLVHFFQQGTIPCLTQPVSGMMDSGGKLILDPAGGLCRNPDGNGGIYSALRDSGSLNQLQGIGVEYLHVFGVDNCLTLPADPSFVGKMKIRNASIGNKVVCKSRPEERVGVMAVRRGLGNCVVEYSEISKELAEMRRSHDSKLIYGAANICNHVFSLSFIQDVVIPRLEVVYHLVKRSITCLDLNSPNSSATTTIPGIKLESFIFDSFPLVQPLSSLIIMEVDRENEFAPIKNLTGDDSPETARRAMSELFKTWVAKEGCLIENESEMLEVCFCRLLTLPDFSVCITSW